VSRTLLIRNNPALTRCCGLYPLLSSVNRIRDVIFSGNGFSCTPEDILSGGPCIDFEADKLTACENEEVTYTFNSPFSITDLQWDFGDGAVPTTAIGEGPHAVTYQTSGDKTVTLTNNGFDPFTKSDYVYVNPNPLDKFLLAQEDQACGELATNIIIPNSEPGILYALRNDLTDSIISGPLPGTEWLFTDTLTETTTFNILATNPISGCNAEMSIKPTIVVNPTPIDKSILVESPVGPVGHATNILVIDGEPSLFYILRNDDNDSIVAGPSPGNVGLFTGALFETTTFNVLAFDLATGCDAEMSTKATVTIDESLIAPKGEIITRIGSDDPLISEESRISVYPNPNRGSFHILIENGKMGSYQVLINDMAGREIYNEVIIKENPIYHQQLTLVELPTQIYFLTIMYENEIIERRRLAIVK